MSINSRLNKVSSLLRQGQRSARNITIGRCRRIQSLPIRASPTEQRHIPVPHVSYGSRNSSAIRWNSSSTETAQNDDHQQPQQMMDAFSLLHLERKFDVSDDELKQSYRQLMAVLHPDKHHSKAPNEQEDLRQQASQVTQAYQIIKDIPARATHLLQLLGRIDADAVDDNNKKEDASATTSKRIAGMEDSTLHDLLGESSKQTSMMLLMEVMELREAIEEANGDEALQELLDDNKARMDDVYKELTHAFSTSNKDGTARTPDLDRALECTVMMQYYNRIDETIREKMDR